MEIDLNIENYSKDDLFTLFGIDLNNDELDESTMKMAKRVVLKTHPDKSKLSPKYFLFFSKAYKMLYQIYQFQNKYNKSMNTMTHGGNIDDDMPATENKAILDQFFKNNSELSNVNKFNKWFNDKFEKHKLYDEDKDTGYGDWLKTDEGIMDVSNVSRTNMNSVMEQKKEELKSIVKYNGVSDIYSSFGAGTSLTKGCDTYTSDNLFSNSNGQTSANFVDLKEAYIETIIPVTTSDYNNIKKFSSIDQLKRYRDSSKVAPLDEKESLRQLYNQHKQLEDDSIALAYKYAQESETIKSNNNLFFQDLKRIK